MALYLWKKYIYKIFDDQSNANYDVGIKTFYKTDVLNLFLVITMKLTF